MQAQMLKPRAIKRIIHGTPTSDGAGVKLTRIIGTPALSELDPFLLFDEFRSEEADGYAAAFPIIRIAVLKPSPI